MAYTTITAATIGLADGDTSPTPVNGTVRITPRFPAAATSGGLIATGPVVVEVTDGAMPETDVPAQADATGIVEFHLYDPATGPVRMPNTEIPLDPDTTINLRDYLPAGVDPSTGQAMVRGPRGYGITGISADNGIVTVTWDGGDDSQIPIPSATLATRYNDGLMPKASMAAIEPIRVGADGWRVVDSAGRVAIEVDGEGRTHIYDPALSSQSPQTVHVFIAAGQSNMQGRGFPVEGPQSPRILQYGANNRVIEQAPLQLDMVPGTAAGTSPALFFADHYLATLPDNVSVLLVPAAYGGTKFSGSPESPAPEGTYTWTKGAAYSPEYALYERSVEQAQEAIAAAESAGYHAILKGVLWHQGEGNGGMATAAYAALLDNLISDYRADLDHPTLPVMIGQQCPEGMEDNTAKYTVDAAHQDTPYRTPFTGFAPASRNAHNDGDTSHFSTVGTSHLGDTYLTAYTQAVGNTRRSE